MSHRQGGAAAWCRWEDYPAKYSRIVVNSPKEMDEALKAIKDLPLNGKTMDATSAARRARRTAAKKARQGEVIMPLPEDSIRLYHCRASKTLEKVAGIAPHPSTPSSPTFPTARTFCRRSVNWRRWRDAFWWKAGCSSRTRDTITSIR